MGLYQIATQDFRDQHTCQAALLLPRVEELHIEDKDIRADGFCDVLPFDQRIFVIPPQPINAFDDQKVYLSCRFDTIKR